MTSSGYEVVPYEARHRESVLDLQSLHWGPDRDLNDQLFAWKYEQNPWVTEPRVYLVLHDGEPVGTRGLYGSRWEVGTPTQMVDIPCAGDLVIAPAYRDRGVFTLLMRFTLAAIAGDPAPFVFNLSAGAAARLGALSMGWRDLGPLSRLKWERPRSMWDRLGRSTNASGSVDPFASIDQLLVDGNATLGQRVVLSRVPSPAGMADLVRRRRHDGRIRHVRDEAWFAWRFRQPTARFRFLFLQSRDGAIDGYLVLHCKPKGAAGPVQIVDCEGDEASAGVLLEAVVRKCGLDRIVAWRATLEPVGEAAIRRAGFTDIEVRSVAEAYPTVLVLPNAHSPVLTPWRLAGRDVLAPANWDLRQAFSDGG